jgi:hypothetical protein
VRLALLFVSGCAMLSTRAETATRDMRLNVTIDSTDAGTHVVANLGGPFGDPDLGPDDSLALLIDGATIVTGSVSSLTLDVAPRGGEFAFALHHPGDHDATATVILVPPSNIHATSVSGKLILDWTPHEDGGTTTITVKGTCIEPHEISVLTDTGHYELEGAQLQTLPAPCAITLGLSRSSMTTVSFADSPFMFASLAQSETAEGTWTP